ICWPWHPAVFRTEVLPASEPRSPLQPVVGAAPAAVLPGAGRAAGARHALGPKRRRRHPAELVRGGGGLLGPARVHGLLDRRRGMAGGARSPAGLAPARERVLRHVGRSAAAGALVRVPGGRGHERRARRAADSGPPGGWLPRP